MLTQHHWHTQSFWLHHHKMMYWEETRTLIASDLHLGKSGHFRKSGLAVPQQMFRQDLMRLFAGLQQCQPQRLLIVGDLVHSTANKELDLFLRWRQDLPALQILLVKGNHDILPEAWYTEAGIDVKDAYTENGIAFTHDPADNKAGMPTICGHIHPGISIAGMARQSLRLPCFYFGENLCVLPAFGLFTGTHPIKPKKKDTVFAITAEKLIRL